MTDLTQSPAWRALQDHACREAASLNLSSLFAADGRRAADFSAEAPGLYLDYSRQRVSRRTRELLLQFAAQQQLGEWIERLFGGEAINHTEHRAALHTALRAPAEAVVLHQGRNVVPDVHEVLGRMAAFATQLRSAQWRGHTGEPLTDVVNIGIGGSDLGPRMVCEALQDQADGPRVHFVANADGAQISSLLHGLDPVRTLFVITSKTFSTQETMANAASARDWFLANAPESAIAHHFVAVSTHLDAVQRFGIPPENCFGFWDWVGGRYSVWSAVGLSVMLAIGPQRFRELLDGAAAMDAHFREAPHAQNLPVWMALLTVWNSNFLGAGTQVIAPYAQRLEKFVPWLQQLEMESNGKGVNRDGHALDYTTTPALWGGVGTNSQHAFFQMLHQGPVVHPVEFILPIEPGHPLAHQHRLLIANCLAQSAALMQGKSADAVRAELRARGLQGAELEAAIPHRVFSGNRPSNTLLLARLDPWHLGALMALYEHRSFVLSVLWQINAFDQWGVELGKQLAGDVLAVLEGQPRPLDPASGHLIQRLRSVR
jgi:glucose-6-phosphate isomerase